MRTTSRRWSALAAVLVVLVASPVGAADGDVIDSTGWTLAVESGVQELASRDELGSPLMYEGLGAPVGIRTEFRSPEWSAGGRLGGISTGFNAGELTAAPATETGTGHRASPVFVELAAWLDWPLATPGNHRLSAGMQLGNWTFFRSYQFHPAQIGAVETWESAITADIRARIEQKFDDVRWELATSFALAGRIMRPSYSIRGDQRIDLVEGRHRVLTYGRWTAVHRLQVMRVDTGIVWWPRDRWGVTGRYRAGLLSYRGELKTRAFSQQAMVGLQFRFY